MGRIYNVKKEQATRFQCIAYTLGLEVARLSGEVYDVVEVIPQTPQMHDALTTIVDYLNNKNECT